MAKTAAKTTVPGNRLCCLAFGFKSQETHHRVIPPNRINSAIAGATPAGGDPFLQLTVSRRAFNAGDVRKITGSHHLFKLAGPARYLRQGTIRFRFYNMRSLACV